MTRVRGIGRWVLLSVAGLLWWLLAFRWAPALVTDALAGESFGPLNDLARRLPERPLTAYLARLRTLAWGGTALLAFAALARLPHTGPFVRRSVAGERTLGAGEVSRVALWFGLLAGLAEGLHVTAWFLIEQEPSRRFDWEFAWMAAPAAAIGFLVLGAALYLLVVTLVPRTDGERPRPAIRLVTFTFALAAVFGILVEGRLRLFVGATAILSVGLATIVSRFAARDPARFLGFVRRTRIPLAMTALATVVLGILFLPAVQERRRVAALPAAAEGAPNVILIILDTVRAKSLSLYGYERPTTPNLERWAEGGVRFDRAFSTTSWTLPAHASLFTGRWHHEVSADYGVRLDDEHETIAERLGTLGYHTIGFTANRPNAAAASGLARGFARYEDYVLGPGPFLTRSFVTRELLRFLPLDKSRWRVGGKSATENTDDVLTWLPEELERPLFLFINYFDAHDPYPSPARYRDRFPSDVPPIRDRGGGFTEEALDGTRALYDAAIAYVDEEVDRLLRGLEARGVLENAIVIITSDHGEAFGEHGLMYHGNHLYAPVTRVPLLIVSPGRIPAGAVVETPVTLRDIPATIVEMVTEGSQRFSGRPLRPLWGADPPEEQGPLVAQLSRSWLAPWPGEGALRSLVSGPYQYLRYPDGADELYDLVADPRQRTDLSDDPGNARLLTELAGRLDSMTSAAPAGRAAGRTTANR